MKALNNYIQEKFLIDVDTSDQNYTDKELRNDYGEVGMATTKAEKQAIAQKYNVNSNKIRDIQLVILDQLRKNRQNKKEFNENDVSDFNRFDIKEREYEKYLDQEPIDFVKVIFDYYEKYCKKHNLIRYAPIMNQRDWNYRMSIADKWQLQKYVKLKQYLEKHNYKF